ncbi:uncharacterized protein K452DRAFT_314449 [Aplosporella prunicola CBS 121167]|uniref:Uncharacterized protein n=1 Tax=Aplosporella prunicola CBS 121167 TaxID=1176127 RepID=A0A6A6BVE3_9PEZI|nr:uncharacterized protein K452DRAFT_314449 [Aplosporella prunicola CBS 121167]KAF2147245.1 hypothetical protein K452DRAFT_314449 [Aplosporella prunicola CBS 121167]
MPALPPPVPDPATSASLLRRQSNANFGYIPLTYKGLSSGPPPGTVVGIVLGSVAGFLLLMWLLSALTGLNGRRNQIHGDEEIVARERKAPAHGHRSRRGSTRPEVREVREHIVVMDEGGGDDRQHRRHSRRRSMPPQPPQPRPRSRSVLVEERVRESEHRVAGDDVVEVIEEHSPPRTARRGSRRESYRSVDPMVHPGSDYVPRGRSYSRHSRYS